uniref:Lipid desaturase domain-containing protein n=1 Tax=Oryza brachyantha TaxID=4533 RepID=J3MLQ3_ORYBR
MPVDAVATTVGAPAAPHTCVVLSQQFHSWAHENPHMHPRRRGAVGHRRARVARPAHVHHWTPYNNNYCIVSGVWNELLDRHTVFEA